MQRPNGPKSNVLSIQEEIDDLERKLKDAKQRLNSANGAPTAAQSLTSPGIYMRTSTPLIYTKTATGIEVKISYS